MFSQGLIHLQATCFCSWCTCSEEMLWGWGWVQAPLPVRLCPCNGAPVSAGLLPDNMLARCAATGHCRPHSLIQRAEKRGSCCRGRALSGMRPIAGGPLLGLSTDALVRRPVAPMVRGSSPPPCRKLERPPMCIVVVQAEIPEIRIRNSASIWINAQMIMCAHAPGLAPVRRSGCMGTSEGEAPWAPTHLAVCTHVSVQKYQWRLGSSAAFTCMDDSDCGRWHL